MVWQKNILTLIFFYIFHINIVWAENSQPKILIEYFTSTICFECFHAIKNIDLVTNDDTFILQWHITAFDKAEHKDKLAIIDADKRHIAYKNNIDINKNIHAPLAVINGTDAILATKKQSFLDLVTYYQDNDAFIDGIFFNMDKKGKNSLLDIYLDGRDMIGGDFDIFLISYDAEITSDIRLGPNTGKQFITKNLARDIQKITSWDGNLKQLIINTDIFEGKSGLLMILQESNHGSILAVNNFTFDNESAKN